MDFSGRSGEMEIFARVAQEGSLSAAARALGLTPSAVSRILARTEQRLGTRLLLRTTRAITLTPRVRPTCAAHGGCWRTCWKSKKPSLTKACHAGACGSALRWAMPG
jgi:hypothetical protein